MYWMYLACAQHAVDSAQTSFEEGYSLSDFARMSLDIRGYRPTPTEISAFLQTPNLDLFVDGFLDDPHFSEQMAWIWNESIHTALWANQYTRFGSWDELTWKSVGWEPLASLQLIIDEKRSFLDWVSHDKQVINQYTASLWDLSYEGEGWGWIDMDGDRPHAGVLSSRALWLRYNADTTNRNRMRANVVADIFLCAGFLNRPGDFEFNVIASALNNVEKAIQTQPSCIGCHSGLDSLGSFFGGFTERSTELPLSAFVAYSSFQAQWHAQRLSPSYYGIPGSDLSDLGRYIAADPRYSQCAVQRIGKGFLGKELSQNTKHTIHQDFVDAEYRIRPLVRALVLHPEYTQAEIRTLNPTELFGTLYKVFGSATPDEIKWSHKYRVLLGYGNDNDILLSSNNIGVSHHLVLTWVATEIASALLLDRQRPQEERIVLRLATDDSEEQVRIQIQYWWISLFSEWVETDAPQVDELYALFNDAGGGFSPEEAWSVLLEAIIRHPKILIR